MVVSIRNRGDAVLIVTRHAGTDLMGYVARSVLKGFFWNNPSMCDCISFVDLNLTLVEQIMLRKTFQTGFGEGQMPCVEITEGDLAEAAAHIQASV